MEDHVLKGPVPIQGVCDISSAKRKVERRVTQINKMLLDGPIPIQSLCDIISAYHGLAGTRRIALRGHTDYVMSFAVRADATLASGSKDRTVRVWDVSDGECLQTLVGHTAGVYTLAVLPCEKLASASYDYTVRVWDVPSGACLRTLSGHTHWVLSLAPIPQGLVSGSLDGTMRFWDTSAGVCLRTVKRSASFIAVLPDGKLATGGAVSGLQVWRDDNRLVAFNPHISLLNGLTALPDGHLASCSSDTTVCVSDPSTGHQLCTFRHDGWVMSLAVMPDGNLASGSRDHTVRVWDPTTGECIININTGDAVDAIAALPSGEIAVGFGVDGSCNDEAFDVHVWE